MITATALQENGKVWRMKDKYDLTRSEEEIMELLWEMDQKMSSKEILDYFNENCDKDWKKQTLNTFLTKLLQAGFIERISKDRKYLYAPLVTRREYKQKGAERFIRESYRGSFMNFVSALSGGEMISREEAEEIRKLLEENRL